MKLEAYLTGLSQEKRQTLLGRDTEDSLHQAFSHKRVVHAGLIGEAIMPARQQQVWQAAMQQPADLSNQHAVYIHIPFCQTRCLYCGFYQNASRQEVEDAYVDDLLAEIEAEADSIQLRETPIKAVFIGGGTPTSLSAENASRLLDAIQCSFSLVSDCEVTLEGRVHDLVPEKIEAWLSHGVNRISLGVQSFDTVLRQRVGRIDSREEVLKRLELLKSYDVTVIVDLIYGLPGQTMEIWMDDVKTLALADVDGMDLYQLNVFPNGPLDKAVANGSVPPCATIAEQADMYVAARDYLLDSGVERLSLCHFRRSKRERSLYNTLAKTGAVVYPFGCGAGGNFGGLTFMQLRELKAYHAAMAKGEKPLMMLARQVEPKLKQATDNIIADLEKGFVDFRRLSMLDCRLEELDLLLTLWQQRGLMTEDLGVYRLTKAGEFWYISLTQSLVEAAQVVMKDKEKPLSLPAWMPPAMREKIMAKMAES